MKAALRALLLCVALASAAGCDSPNEPTASILSGSWQGTSTYFNAPFSVSLEQRRERLTGTYQDKHDTGTVGGEVKGTLAVIHVDFGDTGILLSGTIRSATRIEGTITGPVIGGIYEFVMTR